MTADTAYDRLMAGAARARWDAADLHVAASILALALSEAPVPEDLPAHCGLDAAELAGLLGALFPAAPREFLRGIGAVPRGIEEDSLRTLLLAHAGGTALAVPLASMIARRAMEPDHLWQDLGLRNRGELSAMLTRHFGPLAAKNTANMKWKRFFYRLICEEEGFVLCATPVCTDCADFDMCFGEESGESRLARAGRAEPPDGSPPPARADGRVRS
ncbi:nitrogen fixation protein NifQ [Rhodovulum sp. BSW8]|uniref:Nitrogen fixation protein NifQ n=1 Tax=Rhodovulum visakhapatnamense TaxID=364297 RepID=A0A4R8GBR2_9RHOB|nr:MULTISPECIES: nitrogen fixation protein NifQ [Rhodovulum]OLS43910.1 hypothetical protein BV509_05880 [Rhodovulum sulfidophilum]MBL3571302.1 nitrogen fixation protein NifQ [Rhodovulum visakhapatnamense]MBL3579164.1 nitrogen fixation protein NifQ [Rhodovulum visakhapatnamense]RBO52170.1 nitrogen fixation protein NifQ [Rhodovulum sp. BSW8]TDX33140.1 nitrogen fixation protein NifQ [Rhodovulum visakhapatnamense]